MDVIDRAEDNAHHERIREEQLADEADVDNQRRGHQRVQLGR